MSQRIVEAIFNSKKNLNDLVQAEYPPGAKIFDLQRRHLFYGRIDRDGDAVYLNTATSDGYLTQLIGAPGASHLALDFVAAAFDDMIKNVRKAANAGYIAKQSLYPTNMVAHKSWTNGDLQFNYNNYIGKLYTTFVDSYLQVDHRADKIKNFNDFVKEFLNFSLRTAMHFPITRTGYLTSLHCSPFISGLMIEVANQTHGLQNNKAVINYINDPNFKFFVKEAKKFGFMIDKNAPWRMVFNLASGGKEFEQTGIMRGGMLYMDKLGTTFDSVFSSYYRKAYIDELSHIRDEFFSMYDNFYQQFGTYEEMNYVVCDKNKRSFKSSFSIEDDVLGRITTTRKNRHAPPSLRELLDADEYWLKVILKLRMAETKTPHTPHNFNFYVKKMIQNYRLFGEEAALKYINELTKGFHVTKFVSKGSYWYGISEKEYQQRISESRSNAISPDTVDYALTGVKNIK